MSLKEQQELESQYVMGTFARKPVEFVRGEGMTLYDDEGRAYLDFLSGIGVACLGHCHPAVSGAIAHQAQRLIHVSNYYYIEGRGEVAKRLSDMLNDRGYTGAAPAEGEPEAWKTFFANSGAEANECAIKLARLAARKRVEAEGGNVESAPRVIVTLKRSFHGRTLATLAATAQPAKQEAFQPLPGGFAYAPINDLAALKALFAEQPGQICAVMVECVQGESGVFPCDPGYLEAAVALAHEHGALFICDEVQCGIFRCGEHPFAFQKAGITPDIVSMAKGIASGFPMGACAARASVADAFSAGDHGSTFGGSNLAIAAAKATLETLCEADTASHVERVGAYLRARLAELPCVAEVRGWGLMCACEFTDAVDAPALVLAALEQGLVLNYTGPHTLRFLPPLICTEAEVDELIARLSRLLAE